MNAPAHFNHSIRRLGVLIDETRPRAFATDRGDGYDANDPRAPAAWHCDGCDKVRDHRRMFCPNCEEVTGAWCDGEVPSLVASIEAQLADPTYADRRAAGQAMIDLSFDARRDADLIRLGYIDAPAGREAA